MELEEMLLRIASIDRNLLAPIIERVKGICDALDYLEKRQDTNTNPVDVKETFSDYVQ